ncbi:ABC transporter permease [Nocardioides sp.]|uniref:ABC transporter permease n=1 Tax=Nocardioides sp. TaxID=35761 RepID=UPI0039E3D2CD
MSVGVTNPESEQLPDQAAAPESQASEIAGKSPTQLAMARFRKDRLSMVSLVVVVVYIMLALAAPLLVKSGFLDPYTLNQKLLDPNTLPLGKLGGISGDHWLGVEPGTGRDAMSRLWYGVTFSLVVALVASVLTMLVGVVLGIIAGFSRSWADPVIGRVIDLILCFPSTLMLLALHDMVLDLLTNKLHVPAGVMAQGVFVVVVLSVFGWPTVARVVRGQVLSIREREFVDAALLLGASRRRIYFKEILPNVWAPILVQFTLIMPTYISAEAALSYLQVSIKPPTPTLGNVLRASLQYADSDPVYFFAPALLICIIVVSFNLLGDGLRDALDPKGNR